MAVADTGFLASTITHILSVSGYGGLLGLMSLESACIPLPSEIILPFAGFLVARGEMNLWLVAIVGALGCNLGSLIAYWVGRWGGRRAIERWGKYVLLTREDLETSDRFFARFGNFAVLIARMLPGVRTFIALPAGIARMPQLRFHLYTFIGSFPWCLMLAYVGYLLGEAWNTNPWVGRVFHYFDYAVLAVVVIMLIRFVLARRRREQRGERAAPRFSGAKAAVAAEQVDGHRVMRNEP